MASGRLQTIEFSTPFGPWRLWLWAPAPDLRASVATLWATEARTVAFRERVLPRQTVELMLIESPTAAQLIAASLHPAHAGPLLDVSGRELAGRVVPLDEVISSEAERLAARLEETPSVAGRFLLFEDFLRHRLRHSRRAPHPAACRTVDRLLASGGREPIRGLSAEFGCSPRYLESRLQEEAGLSPNRLARLIRFSHAVESFRVSGRVEIGQLALDCGYYDQAHFNRDFREFAGVSPGVFLATRESSSQAMFVE